ncbi:MAG: prepilin-type N-terminal cleavage/methylation domain-containing protein, partial [Thermodesulfovibrionales bacterium]
MGDVRAAKQQNIGELVKGLIGEEVKKPIHPFTYSPIHLKITALLRGCSMWVKPHGPRITDYGFTLLELIIVIFLITIIL